ncbi:MAG: D-alanine--D-alanine ligase [Calditrichia bacterium]
MKIAVLLGGTSAERDVSLSTGIAVARALAENGHHVEALDPAYGVKQVDFSDSAETAVKVEHSEIEKERDVLNRNVFRTIDYLIEEQFDAVFLALHGGYGEDGKIQALLDLAGVPYSGSGSCASAVAMDKHLSKVLMRSEGISTADWLHLKDPDELDVAETGKLGYPLVVKPNAQGSTVGLTIVNEASELPAAVKLAFEYDVSVMLEAFVPGREMTVTVLADEALPIIEIIPKSGFYDYESKYQSGMTTYICPAETTTELKDALQTAALQTHRVLGCRGYSRVDFRVNEANEIYCLEANTLPGMTGTSLVPKAGKAAGMSFYDVIMRILKESN